MIMRIKFYNVASSLKAIEAAQTALTTSNMWHGCRAGFKGTITAHNNAIIKYNINVARGQWFMAFKECCNEFRPVTVWYADKQY